MLAELVGTADYCEKDNGEASSASDLSKIDTESCLGWRMLACMVPRWKAIQSCPPLLEGDDYPGWEKG